MSKRMLLVHVAPSDLEIVMRLVEASEDIGCVMYTDSVNQGMCLAKMYHPDYIFLDIEQSKTWGYEMTRQLKVRGANQKLIWMLSQKRNALLAFNEAVDGIIELPLSEEKVRCEIDRIRKDVTWR